MKQKHKFSTELSYVIGLILIAVGTGTITRSNLGIGIVVAPAYMFHRWLSTINPYFTFGVCQYLFQALLLLLICIVRRRFRLTYLFAFISAVIEGYLLDAVMYVVPECNSHIVIQLLMFAAGQVVCSLGITFMLKTYITPEVYEVAVNEFTAQFYRATTSYTVSVVKTIYDCASGAIAIGLSFLLFHKLIGIGVGTILSAVVSGWLIGRFTLLADSHLRFTDTFKLRKLFEK